MQLYSIVFVFSILLLLMFYAIHLFLMNKKLARQKDKLRNLSIELKSEVLRKESQSKEASIALKIISENTFDAIVMLNNLGRITFWNKAAERLFGYSEERVIDCDFIETIISSDKMVEFNNEYKQHNKKDLNTRHQLYHITAIRKDGETFPAELKISDVRHNNTWSTIGIIRNVSDSKTLENELLLAEKRLKLSLQGEDASLWEWNINTNAIYFSPSAQSMRGYEKKDKYSKYSEFLNSIHPDDRQSLVYELEKHLEGKTKMVRAEYRISTAFGNWNWIFTRGKIVDYDENSNPLTFFAINTDINEQKNYELDLENMQENMKSLKSLNKEK